MPSPERNVPPVEHRERSSVDLAGVVANHLTARGLTSLRSRAAFVGIAPSTLNRRLKDKTPFKSTELGQIADALGIRISELVGAAEDAA